MILLILSILFIHPYCITFLQSLVSREIFLEITHHLWYAESEKCFILRTMTFTQLFIERKFKFFLFASTQEIFFQLNECRNFSQELCVCMTTRQFIWNIITDFANYSTCEMKTCERAMRKIIWRAKNKQTFFSHTIIFITTNSVKRLLYSLFELIHHQMIPRHR